MLADLLNVRLFFSSCLKGITPRSPSSFTKIKKRAENSVKSEIALVKKGRMKERYLTKNTWKM